MKRLLFALLVTFLNTLPFQLYARGGGGCLKEGTPVLTPTGMKAVESFKPGDAVLTVSHGKLISATVCDVMKVEPDWFYELVFKGHKLEVTAEHPVETARGEFCMAFQLKTGDKVCSVVGDQIQTVVVESVRQVPATVAAWNLLVSPGGTYVADGLVVHNKGCFLPETLIRRQDGTEVPISRIRPQDCILAFTTGGQMVTAAVEAVITHEVEEYRILKTAQVTLQVTAEHPFYVGQGHFKTLESLKVGDSIYVFDGIGMHARTIEEITPVKVQTRVYNLHTDAPNTFFANGVAVHNKGGGGGGHSSGGGYHGGGYRGSSSHGGSSGGNENPWPILIFLGLFGGVIFLVILGQKKNENLDFVFKPAVVAKKQNKTIKLLDFLAKQDSAVSPQALRKVAEETFRRLQQCWQARDYGPMKPLMMSDLYMDHCGQLEGMKRHHEINKIEGVKVDRIDLVNVRYTFKAEQREFTALITATARDYYVDDRTQRKTRGDDQAAQFQEFWTFQYNGKVWLLREIEQTRESSALKEENFFEQFTDVGLNQIYGSSASAEGSSGPWLEKNVEVKETRIERMLNFLVQTDKVWERQGMLETSRRVFLELMGAWESGEVKSEVENDLFPDMVLSLREQIARNRAQSVVLEFRNLCVRKVELVLIRNYEDNGRDEYVVRIRAHAQRGMLRGGAVVHQDEDVVPFEQHLTFGRYRVSGVAEKWWRLKEILPEGKGADLVVRENLDQDSSRSQLQWYYQHKRAI